MWGSFLLCAAVILLALYVSGYFFFRAFKISRILSVCCAPIYSIAAFGLLPILYQKLGVFCNWAVLLLPAVILPLVLFFALNRQGYQQYGNVDVDRKWLLLGLYLVAGIAAAWFILVSGLGDFDTFYNRHDNSTHLNAIRAFIESGNWSSLGMNTYLSAPENAHPWEMGSAFYPSAWHDIVAFVVSLTGIPVTVACNAFNSVITGIVYPLSMFSLMLFLYRNDRLTIVVGSIITPCFNAFPWYFFLKGPLVSNMLSFAIVPVVCVIFMVLCKRAAKKACFIAMFAIIGLSACAALGLAQPNGLFTFLVFAISFLGHQLYGFLRAKRECGDISLKRAIGLGIAFAIGVVVVWLVAYKLPPLRYIVNYRYANDNGLDPINTLYDTLSLGLVISYPQWLLSILALLGIAALFVRKRPWLAFPPAYFAVAYFCARAFYEKRPRQYLAGFWYSDPTRIAGSLTIFLTPIVSLGVAILLRALVKVMSHVVSAEGPLTVGKGSQRAIIALMLAALACYLYFPNFTPDIWDAEEVTKTPIGIVKQRIANEYDTEREQVYSTKEREFVQKAASLIPEGSLVLNQPHDGSVFAYGLDGLNTYFRSAGTFGYSDTAETIRQGADKIATDKDVQDAVKSTGAEYLILLDQGVAYEDGKWLSTYYDSYVPFWDGLNKVTDETPGYELILADGDMRLYKITATEDGEGSEG